MTVTDRLLSAQAEWFASVDPQLPDPEHPGPGEVITAALPDGRRVAGVVTESVAGPGTAHSLWSARRTWELHPLLGDAGTAGMDALLRAWRRHLDGLGALDGDTACVLTWPSRDVAASRALLDHGLQPLTVVAVRPANPVPPRPLSVQVRRATPADLEVAVQLAMAELRYSAMVGAAVLRPDAEQLKRVMLADRLIRPDELWLAEQDGVALALAECAVVPVTPSLGTSRHLRPGLWGYVGCLSVLPGARRGGIGQQLMAVVHEVALRHRATAHYLHYNPANPLSSVFWPRQGYRPLWTQWEVRPAAGLR
ncbi:GNAT family N-acetyltransferase [Kutzneria viridogrisea]|uniref:GCN5-related N-acetyltransferase n=2 Tax=Kutzneria TaxID=43356 RepID=W5WCN5_9PSEU|nr:GNAT family N-acetyltransferase [Kutzneria albida]AHH95984.1 GCN5-related N-acetyltransferase [Kutzneria albida DSM 43870]MBA8928814.1 GNAT superfamily N-acetyltransferase [Kutzneria viridogrisea]